MNELSYFTKELLYYVLVFIEVCQILTLLSCFFVFQTVKMYKHSNNKAMTTGAIAAMLSTILYSRRFFPYYVYNIIGGLDEEGSILLSGKCKSIVS